MKYGLAVKLGAPAVVEVAGWLGYDFAWIDAEHDHLPRFPELIRAAEAAGVEPWFRVPSGRPDCVSPYLDLGAKGIMVPHVDTAAQAAAAVGAAKFHPLGRRNWSATGRDARYGLVPPARFAGGRNETVRLIVQIETPEAVENVAAILAVPGVDMVATGPGDLAQGYGLPGQPSHPRVKEAEEKVYAAAAGLGRAVLHFSSSAAELQALASRWTVEHVVIATDLSLLAAGLTARLEDFRGPARPRR